MAKRRYRDDIIGDITRLNLIYHFRKGDRNMYKISVPIMSATVNESNREKYVQLCREAGATRVFLCNGSILEPIPASLGENVRYFKSQGFEVGIWTDTLGHGFVLDHVQTGGDAPFFTQMVNIQGEKRPHANCPLDAKFRTHIAKLVAGLAQTGTDIVQLDDDFRMSQHGTELCCACPAHLARIGEILGEEITLEQLRPYVLTGKANRYRDAWLQAQREGLMELVKAIRAEVDKAAPHVTVSLCTACAPWNVDDADVEKCLALLTFLPMDEVRRLGAYKDEKINEAKKVLAYEVTKLIHGQEEADKAVKATEALFGGGADLEHVPTLEIAEADKTAKLVDVLTAQKVFGSKREARQMIAQRGLYLNNEAVEDAEFALVPELFAEDGGVLIRKGKKKYYRLIVK